MHAMQRKKLRDLEKAYLDQEFMLQAERKIGHIGQTQRRVGPRIE